MAIDVISDVSFEMNLKIVTFKINFPNILAKCNVWMNLHTLDVYLVHHEYCDLAPVGPSLSHKQ